MDVYLTNAIDSSGRKARLVASYGDLKMILGNPNREDDPYKVDASWGFAEVGGIRSAGIYNYKNGPAYTGSGTVEGIMEWSVEGDVSLVRDLLEFYEADFKLG